MKGEMDVPKDWSQWTKSRFQYNYVLSVVHIVVFFTAIAAAETSEFASLFFAVIGFIGFWGYRVYKHAEATRGKDPKHNAWRVLKKLPHKQYVGKHEKVTRYADAQALDDAWEQMRPWLP
jgi:hypothetical protein